MFWTALLYIFILIYSRFVDFYLLLLPLWYLDSVLCLFGAFTIVYILLYYCTGSLWCFHLIGLCIAGFLAVFSAIIVSSHLVFSVGTWIGSPLQNLTVLFYAVPLIGICFSPFFGQFSTGFWLYIIPWVFLFHSDDAHLYPVLPFV